MDQVPDWIAETRWYDGVRKRVVESSRRWWREKRWRKAAWAQRRGLAAWMEGVTDVDAETFFDIMKHQGPVVYVWARADGTGDCYIGSTVCGVFMGAINSDRVWGHFAHVRNHRRGECKCSNTLYRAAANVPDVSVEWVFVPVMMLPTANKATILRVEATIIRRTQPRLNTIGVCWTGREARPVKPPRRRPAQRHRRGERPHGRHQGCQQDGRLTAAVAVARVPVRWHDCTPGADLTPTVDGVLSWVRRVRDLRSAGTADGGGWCAWSGGGPGRLCVTNWGRLKRMFGRTPILVDCDGRLVQDQLSNLQRYVARTATGMVKLGLVDGDGDNGQRWWRLWAGRLVQAVGRHDHSKEALIYGCKDRTLLHLWQRGMKKRDQGGSRVCNIVKKEMKRRHALVVRACYVVRVPFMMGGGRVKALVVELITWTLRRRGVPVLWVAEIGRRIKVVFSARDSVGQMLDNHAAQAKGFDVAKPPVCTCRDHELWSRYTGVRPQGQHLQVLLSECAGATVERVSAAGTSFVPRPAVGITAAEILEGVDGCGAALLTTPGKFTAGWGAIGRDRLDRIVTLAARAPTKSIAGLAEAITVRDVHHVRQRVVDLVVSPVDRNPKDRLIECPVLYHAGYQKTFFTDHYEERAESESGILQRWAMEAAQRGWLKYFKLPPRSAWKVPGVCYTMCKMKDLAADSKHAADPRRRPMSPYGGRGPGSKHHPLKRIMKLCGAVLQTAMADAGLRCWHLSSTHKFADGIHAEWDRLAQLGGPDGRTRLFPFDVKAMFTELDKTAVLEAVAWVLRDNAGWHSTSAATGRRYPRGAYVSRVNGKFVARVGSGLRKLDGEVYIPLSVVLEVVEFDLREAVMRCGVHLLWQIGGIPMGSFLSAIVAGLTVAVAEHRFYARLPPSLAERVGGIRFADDGLVAIREWLGVESAAALFKRFVDGCYPPPLELEVEEHEGVFNLLESTIVQAGSALVVSHRLKNWQEWITTGKGRFRVWTGRGSWTAAGSRGLVVGALLRATRSCSSAPVYWRARALAIMRVLVEAEEVGGFRFHELRRTLTYLVTRRGVADPIWPFILEWVGRTRSMRVAFWALHDLFWSIGVDFLAKTVLARVCNEEHEYFSQLQHESTACLVRVPSC
jgi:hypothetical protein